MRKQRSFEHDKSRQRCFSLVSHTLRHSFYDICVLDSWRLGAVGGFVCLLNFRTSLACSQFDLMIYICDLAKKFSAQ